MAKRDQWESWQDLPQEVARGVLEEIEAVAMTSDDVAQDSESARDTAYHRDVAAGLRLVSKSLRNQYLDPT